MAEQNPTPITSDDDLIVKAIIAFWREGESARRNRDALNRRNKSAWRGEVNPDDKMEGQSNEFLPETATTVEQFASFIQRGLTQFGDWFSMELPQLAEGFVEPEAARDLLKCYLDRIPQGQSSVAFDDLLSDGVKTALLESLLILKVHGMQVNERVLVERGEELVSQDLKPWKLIIDLVSPNDYVIDPKGRGLYEIHRVRRDLHEVQRLAKLGVYRQSVVDEIQSDFDSKDEADDTPDGDEKVQGRREVEILEFWGTLLESDGSAAIEGRRLAAVANRKWLIREPEEFPFWHGESPFETIALMREPFSVWHRAIYDGAVALNIAENELFNLMLDGGLAAVWGVRQLRADWLEDPTQITDGIPQGKTLVVNSDAPDGAKVLETVTEGEIPGDAIAMFNIVRRQFQAAAFTNDIQQGDLPARQVLATEIVQTEQSSAAVLDTIVGRVERGLSRLLRKAWLTLLQSADDLSTLDLLETLGPRQMFALANMTPRERFLRLGVGCGLQVHGLSAMLTRARDFQRMMALLQVIQQNPILAPAFVQEVDPRLMLRNMFKLVNVDPALFRRDAASQQRVGQDLQQAQQFTRAGLTGSPASGVASSLTGEPGLPSEINQEAQPTGGEL